MATIQLIIFILSTLYIAQVVLEDYTRNKNKSKRRLKRRFWQEDLY